MEGEGIWYADTGMSMTFQKKEEIHQQADTANLGPTKVGAEVWKFWNFGCLDRRNGTLGHNIFINFAL